MWRPEFDVTPAFNARSIVLPVMRVEGVTWGMLSPLAADSLVIGQGSAVTLDGRFDAALEGSRSLFVNWGSAAHDASGGSRAAQYMLFDQAIREVREPGTSGPAALLLPEGRAALKAYLAGGRVVFFVERASDIRQVVRYAKAHGMKPVIAGGAEAWVVARELADAGVPVILDPLENLPNDFDRLGARFDNAKILHEAGRAHRLLADGQLPPAQEPPARRQRGGPRPALGGRTRCDHLRPGRHLRRRRRRGRIEKGQAADLVLWSGDPLEVTSVAEQVWIAGNPVDDALAADGAARALPRAREGGHREVT